MHYLSVYLAGLLPSAAEQVPSFVLNVANMDIVSIVLAKRNPGATKHKQVVPVQNGCTGQRDESVSNGFLIPLLHAALRHAKRWSITQARRLISNTLICV